MRVEKSVMTLTLPIASSVNFIFSFIYSFTFPLLSGTNDSDFLIPAGESHGECPIGDPAYAIRSFFMLTRFKVLQDSLS